MLLLSHSEAEASKTMTVDEWRALFVAAAANRDTATSDKEREFYALLVDKCILRAQAAKQGRCVP